MAMTNDTHPQDLLAGYVDGMLSAEERAVVEAHLAACGRCREEWSLAMRAVDRLHDLADEPVPLGVTRPVLHEIAERANRTAPRPLSQKVVWAAGGAIAAAIVGLLAITVLPGVGVRSANDSAVEGNASTSAQAGPVAKGAHGDEATAKPVTVERQDIDYDDPALRRLASDTASSGPSDTALAAVPGEAPQPASTRTALACLEKGAGPETRDVLVRLIRARYEGQPALIGVYLTGSRTGRTADTVLVRAVRTPACEIASVRRGRI